ncbi:cobalamin-dependent protein [Sorangium sp. So ce131]|uniref:cobalamin-dependent protein n=1 Tax=Sorangium sp. So ce131 TaxID=3133282 RepID=UPI003F5F5F14
MVHQRIAFIELTVFAGVYPLASGYMRAAATLNPKVTASCSFEIHSICINDERFEDKLNKIDADVYAISCYVWNMGFVKRWLPTLIARKPEAHVILGGPQVMNHAKQYLDPSNERLVLCNGEGEHTFANYLFELCSPEPNLHNVKGLSFFRDGLLITTPEQERIQNLNEIPSPYLEGYFGTGKYVWAPLETNRGCPYQCTYCFWGAATNARVYKSDMDRVKAEISWLSQNRTFYIFITDANFGMLNRDIEIAEHLAECKRKYGYPLTVWLSAAKNSPERVTEITRILSQEGLISTQPVSLQTMDATTLRSVKRGNIKESAYLRLQDDLRRSKLSSFIEMIWPLPGETLDSFKAGIGKLCSYDADAILIHHLLLINNVEMNQQREEYQLEVANDADPNSEAQVVVATRDVSREDYKEGVRFGYHLTSLYSLRALRFVGRHLDSSGRLSFRDMISAFSDFCNRSPDHPYMQYIANVIQGSAQTRFSANGGIFHNTLHEFRREFDQLLFEFAQASNILHDDLTRLLFDMDLLNRPHVYYNTPISLNEVMLRHVELLSKERDGFVVSIPAQFAKTASELLGLEGTNTRLRVRYRSTQMPFMESKPYEDNLSYCEAKLHKMGSILPTWTATGPSASQTKRTLPVAAG